MLDIDAINSTGIIQELSKHTAAPQRHLQITEILQNSGKLFSLLFLLQISD